MLLFWTAAVPDSQMHWSFFFVLFNLFGEVKKMMQHPFYPFSLASLLEKKVERSSLCMCGTIEKNNKKKTP